MQRRETPLPGWRNWVRWKGWRSLDTAHVLTSSWSRAERGLPWRLLGCQRLPHFTSQPELSKWSGPAYCTPQCSTGSGAANKRGKTRPWSQRWPMLRRSPGWAAAAHQEPPRSPRAALLPQLTYQYMLSSRRSLPDYTNSSTTRVGVAEAGGSDWLWETKGIHTQGCIWVKQDAYTGCASDLCLHTGPTCFSTALWGNGPGTERERNRHLKGKESAWAWPQGFFSSNLITRLDPDTDPHQAVMATEQTGSPASHLTSALALHPISSLTAYQGDSCLHTLRKLFIYIKSSPPTKGIRYMTVAYQAPLSMEFTRQEYWSGLPFPSPGDLPDPGIEPRSPALQADALPSELPGKPQSV